MAVSWVPPSVADGQEHPGLFLRAWPNRPSGHVSEASQIFRRRKPCQAPLPVGAMIGCITVVARLVPSPTSGRWVACRARGSSQPAGEVTRLFVDADTHKIDDIDSAISKLEKMGRTVRTLVFAPPGRETKKDWQRFLRRPGIDFRPVRRAASRTGEANDAAITQALRSCADRSIALLTSDFDFHSVCEAVAERGKQVLVLTPSNNRKIIRRYQDAGIPVQGILPRAGSLRAPKVRAILHQDGSGSVKLDDPFYPSDNSELLQDTESFLRDLGYVARDGEYLVHSTAKFWLANDLGPLTVFPSQVTFEEFGQRVLGQGKKWRKQSVNDKAFLLPKTSANRIKLQAAKFGTELAKRLYFGGGPFMLTDSEGMVRQALTQLGYLDEEMNADVLEAMLVFVNIADNRNSLRKKAGVLPNPGDSPAEVEEKLRHAFLSHLTDGQWRVASNDLDVRWLLRDEGLLASVDATRQDVFQAMAEFAKQRSLPEMKTYGGYVFRIRSAARPNSNKVATIEFAA